MSDITYVSGPMTGYNNFNYDAFHEAAKYLRSQGYIVINPAEQFGGDQSLSKEEYLEADIQHVLYADKVAVLHEWWTSEGAKVEVHVAWSLDKPIIDAYTEKPVNIGGFNIIGHYPETYHKEMVEDVR